MDRAVIDLPEPDSPTRATGLPLFKFQGDIKEYLVLHRLVLLIIAVEPEVEMVYFKEHTH